MSNRLDPDQARHFVEPDLGPNCLQRLSADTSRNFLSSADFFFKKIISRISSEGQTVWIQIWPDILSGLILIQTVCKGYQQMILVRKDFFGHLLIDLKITFSKNYFRNTIRVSNSKYPDQA